MPTISLRLTACALALGLLTAAPLATVSAQEATPPASAAAAMPHRMPDPQQLARRLAHKLGLDGGQQSQLATIFGARQQQVAAVRADTTLSPRERRTRLLAIRQDSEGQIQALLSPAQQQQYTQLQQAMQERRASRRESIPAASGTH